MIKLSDHFNFRKLLKFTLPSISMLIFLSIYGVADGFFVSNFVGKIPFTALNFIMPFLMLLGFVGFLFGTGGGALIAKTLGEGDRIKANKIFSMLIYLSIGLGIFLAIVGFLSIESVARILGADGELLKQSVLYGKIVLLAMPLDILQFEFQTLFPTAEKPKFGFYITVLAGVTNIFLDAIFILVFDWGFVGAAAATALSQCIGGIVPLIYFSRENSSLLRLTKTNFDGQALLQTCTNGISEVMTSISMSIVGMLYNVQLLTYAGENGVAAYGILMYVSLIFQAIFIGYAVGVSPIISFHFGAKNYPELKNLLKRSFILISIFAIFMFIGAEIFAELLAGIFVSYDRDLFEMTVRAFRLYSFSFLLSGFTIFTDAFFTALNNGFISAAISFVHAFIFETSCVLLIPIIFSISGIWLAVVVAETLSTAICFAVLRAKRKIYNYL